MATKKKTTENFLSGYLPAGYSPDVTTAQIAQIPPYEDAGISFQGYSKKATGSNQWQLTPQQRFFLQDNAANTLSAQIPFVIPTNRALYVSSIWFSGTAGASTDSWILRDGSIFISEFQNFDNHQEQIIFDPPLKFTNSLSWEMQQSPSQLYLNFFGWLE
jgi:hypothetical protein